MCFRVRRSLTSRLIWPGSKFSYRTRLRVLCYNSHYSFTLIHSFYLEIISFDSVLYPDIVKLCDDPPRDVYGQEKPLPGFNIFVAGTSCKNFSMMMSNKRLDIEDKGCSGETFLAACELLMKDKPKFAVFENVTKGKSLDIVCCIK